MVDKRIVIKVGSSTLTHEGGKPNLQKLEQLARVISEMKNRGHEVVLVSSGAIAVGKGRMKISSKPDIATKQALAAIGQSDLIGFYDRFSRDGVEYLWTCAFVIPEWDTVFRTDAPLFLGAFFLGNIVEKRRRA